MAIKTITATQGFTDSAGNLLALGSLILQLSQVASASTSGGGQLGTLPIVLPLDANGKITGQPVNLWANDQLTPATTTYSATFYNANGLRVGGPVNWTITGSSPIDVSALNP